MKKKFDLRNVFLSIVSFLLVSCTLSCSFLFLDNIKHAEPSPGSLTVQITGASLPGENTSSARTLVPSLTSNAKSYVVTCTQGGSEVASETLNTIASYTFNNLKPGTVTVTVNAYNHATAREAGNLIATGSKDVILTSGSAANADVQLTYSTTDGTGGSINYTIQWPAASADSFKWKIDGSPYSAAITGLESGANLIGIMSAPSVTSGPHSLIIQFLKNDVVVGYAFESVNVYANLESNSVVADGILTDKRVFTAAEIAS
ncbi:MAG TPA: hypothetical protein VJ861_12020, partial [Treponemataceae bacterium]|nr:hypothetical protein [Treponemataceae bacterium]